MSKPAYNKSLKQAPAGLDALRAPLNSNVKLSLKTCQYHIWYIY